MKVVYLLLAILIPFLFIADLHAGVPIPESIMENERNQAPLLDTVFLSIDLSAVTLPPAAGQSFSPFLPGVEPSPFIIWRSGLLQLEFGLHIMTLNSLTGAPMGSRLQMELPSSFVPAKAIWMRDFAVPSGTITRMGIEPVPWVIARNYAIYTFPITFLANGTPQAGPPALLYPDINTTFHGYATCAAELPGSEFSDNLPRLFIGTDNGQILVLTNSVESGIALADSFIVSAQPIVDLEPIPQSGYIALGAIHGGRIHGLRFTPAGGAPWVPASLNEIFTLTDPRQTPPLSFDTFDPDNSPLPVPPPPVNIVIANGSADLALAPLNPNLVDSATLDLTIGRHPYPVKALVAGSLLMLADDQFSVNYDPDYSPINGFSGCDVNITDTVSDICGYTCGDPNNDDLVNIRDITYLVNFLYKSGPEPIPVPAGDPTANGLVNIQDVTYLINFLYKSGPDPHCP